MPIGLAALLLVQTSDVPEQHRLCIADFTDGDRRGHVALLVGADYTPYTLTALLYEPDGWTRTEIRLDPGERHFPGLMSYISFAIRFTREPVLPLTVNGYADGRLRWRHELATPFWPTTLDPSARVVRIGRGAPGTADGLSRADDGEPVTTPRELRIEMVDARGIMVGEARFALPGPNADGPAVAALAAVESQFRGRLCFEPPPLID